MKKFTKTISAVALMGFLFVNQASSFTAVACQAELSQGNTTSQFCK